MFTQQEAYLIQVSFNHLKFLPLLVKGVQGVSSNFSGVLGNLRLIVADKTQLSENHSRPRGDCQQSRTFAARCAAAVVSACCRFA